MRIGVLALMAALALAGCGAVHNGGTAAPAPSTPLSCHQQYETWKHGPAKEAYDRFAASMRAVQAAASAEDLPRLTATLKRAGHTAAGFAATPPPHCADPKGYYGQLLARITAAGDNAKSAGGLGGVLLAEAPLKTVPGIERKLKAELDSTVGVKH